MHGYLTADITFPEMRFEDQIMFKDKYASIFSRQMEAFVLSFKCFSQRAGKLSTNSQLFTASDVRFSVLFGTIYEQKKYIFLILYSHSIFFDLELNFVRRVFRIGHKV